ncbi:chemotaxis protein histidine kinase-like protein [Hoeflea sp. IMCC20628]|uniref:chemotaxis protein CheA n=1 Tax=Hoeflea sp. IMCC20628 TaxID=1620421 RepID=UPI00063AC1FE|nr:chemotaxis protein CheA [Hoeflea sp. IMCC20628]AKI02180.1 chemotaxis protein histidine kinase-like protein [Hoeflea sp. IMCC20628]
MDMNEIREIFFQECEEQLAELEFGLLRLKDGDTDPETVNAVFRAVHSIKGGAGAFGLDDLVAFAHVFETALDCIRSNTIVASAEMFGVMLKSADVLADLTACSRDGGSVDKSRASNLAAALEAFADNQPRLVMNPSEPVQTHPPVETASVEEPVFQPVPFDFDEFDDAEATASRRDQAGRKLFTVHFKPRSDLYAKGNEAVLLLRDLAKIGDLQVFCETETLPRIDQLDPEGAYFSWRIRVETDENEDAIRQVFEFAEWDCALEVIAGEEQEPSEAPVAVAEDQVKAPMPFDISGLQEQSAAVAETVQPTPAAQTPAAAGDEPVALAQDTPEPDPVPVELSSVAKAVAAEVAKTEKTVAAVPAAPQTIRVDLERVDRLINLVGELVINQSMLAQSVVETNTGGSSAINLGLDELQQLTREIQDSVMAIRAQPVKPVFQRMGRIVRETADMTGKNVRLVTEGENTEVDKTLIDKLAEPLTHLIRNAIDHGLETSEERTALGKDPEGNLRLTAKHRSGRIVIEIADDGAGINRERVRSKAAEKGLIAADANLSDEEIYNLIFHPGFSTADQLTGISGRGVGMDVVKRSIQSLGGRLSINSKPGVGTVFTMSLPLTLAVLDGMVVTVAGQTLVVPLTAIIETLQPEKKDIHAFGSSHRLIAIREVFCPLVDVGHILDFRSDLADPVDGVVLLVEAEGGGQRALMVDAIQGQRQVVIKSLEANYRHVPGIAAATILGDGRVALILDVDAVVMASRGHALGSELTLAATG